MPEGGAQPTPNTLLSDSTASLPLAGFLQSILLWSPEYQLVRSPHSAVLAIAVLGESSGRGAFVGDSSDQALGEFNNQPAGFQIDLDDHFLDCRYENLSPG